MQNRYRCVPKNTYAIKRKYVQQFCHNRGQRNLKYLQQNAHLWKNIQTFAQQRFVQMPMQMCSGTAPKLPIPVYQLATVSGSIQITTIVHTITKAKLK